MRVGLTAAAVLCATLGSESPVRAQTSATGIGFADAAIFADPDDARVSQTVTPGGGFAVGFGSRRKTVRFEFAIPRWHFTPLRTYSVPEAAVGDTRSNGSYTSFNQTMRRTVSYDVLYARHLQINDRVLIAGLIGGGFVQRPSHYLTGTRITLSTGTVVDLASSDDPYSDDTLTPVGGVDIEIRLARHVALVPEVRLRAYPLEPFNERCCRRLSLTVKQALALRWRF
jgi:hypothetical protein